MKQIQASELLKSNRFLEVKMVKSVNPNADIKERKMFKLITPSREEAKKMHLRTLGLYVACYGLKFRTPEKCAENGNYWMAKGKQAILDQFFPEIIDNSLNSLF